MWTTLDMAALIKNFRPTKAVVVGGYCLKFALVLVLGGCFNWMSQAVVTAIATHNTVKIWQQAPVGNSFAFTPSMPTDQQDKVYAAAVHRMILKNASQFIIAQGNGLNSPQLHATDGDDGNVLKVNATYLKLAPVTGVRHLTRTGNGKVTVRVYVPAARRADLARVKRSVTAWLKEQTAGANVAGKHSWHVNYYLINNTRRFNYTFYGTLAQSISVNPIIISVPEQLLTDDWYYTAAQAGSVQLRTASLATKMVNQANLAGQIVGVTSLKSQIAQKIAASRNQIVAVVAVICLALVAWWLLVAFCWQLFAANHHRRLALNTLFGISNRKIYTAFIASHVLIDAVLLFISAGHSLSSFLLALSLLIAEAVSLAFGLHHQAQGYLQNITKERG